MRKQLEDPGAVGADAERQHHQAKLAHGGIGDGALQVVLEERPDHAKDRCDTAHDGEQRQRPRAGVEERVAAADQVDAADGATRGVDQGGGRRGGLRTPRQPHVQRELRRLCRGRDEDEDRHNEEAVGADFVAAVLAGQRLKVELVEAEEDVGDGHQQRQVADRGDSEGTPGGGGRLLPLPPVPDHQVGRQRHQAEEQQHREIAGRQRDAEHGEGGEQQDAEEADDAILPAHESNRVDLDEQADEGHREGDDGGQGVGQHAPLKDQLRGAARLPGEELKKGRRPLEVERMGDLDRHHQQRGDDSGQGEDDRNRRAQPARVDGEGQDDQQGDQREK